MVEFECDDALATAAARFAASPSVERVVVCSPDKDLTQCVQGDRVVCFDRMRRKRLDERGVVEKFGVYPKSIPDWLALVGDSADGYPGVPRWGAKSAAAVLGAYEKLEAIPADAAAWRVAVRGAPALAASLAAHRTDAFLFRQLATLRVDVPLDGVARRLALARAGYGGARRARGAVGRRRDRRAGRAARDALATARMAECRNAGAIYGRAASRSIAMSSAGRSSITSWPQSIVSVFQPLRFAISWNGGNGECS